MRLRSSIARTDERLSSVLRSGPGAKNCELALHLVNQRFGFTEPQLLVGKRIHEHRFQVIWYAAPAEWHTFIESFIQWPSGQCAFRIAKNTYTLLRIIMGAARITGFVGTLENINKILFNASSTADLFLTPALRHCLSLRKPSYLQTTA